MLAALDHQKAMQTQQEKLLEKEIVRQREEWAKLEGILGSVRRDHHDVKTEVQTLSEQLKQALKQVGDLTDQLGQTQREIQHPPPVSQPGPATFATMPMPTIPESIEGPQVTP